MQPGTSEEVRRILLLVAVAGLFGLSIGYFFETLFLALSAHLIWTIYQVTRLRDWIVGHMQEQAPDTDGMYGEIVDALTRAQRRDTRRQQQLRYRIKRFAMMTEALDEGLLVLDSDLLLSWWNPAAAALMGLRKEDRGAAIINLVREPAFVSFVNARSFTEPLEMSSPHRREQTLQFTGARFGEGETVLVVSDISRLRALEGLRREFVGNVSHELRTPLTVLRGYVETLEDTEPPPGMQGAYGQMAAQIDRMQALADDLVLLARLESMDYERDSTDIDLGELLAEICREADQISKGLHVITLEVEPGTFIKGSQKELYSGLSNLVFNAIRHNPEGASIEVSAASKRQEIQVAVSDDGVGIDRRFLPRLTERFFRVDSGRGRSTGGTGLGLAIVKHVLNQHNATLTIDSRLGRGSTFVCHFPRSDEPMPEQVNA